MDNCTCNFSIYEPLIKTITEQIPSDRPLVLAIDGPCGSGKTTLADYLQEKMNASVIHMDHFFLPFSQKTRERLLEPGGNIHYERFLEIITPALKENRPFSYTAYDCKTASYNRQITITSRKLIVVEGSYSLHEKFGKYYDYAVFLTIPYDTQLRRLHKRCTDEAKFERFIHDWIPMEQRYHTAQKVQKRCDFVIDTSFMTPHCT